MKNLTKRIENVKNSENEVKLIFDEIMKKANQIADKNLGTYTQFRLFYEVKELSNSSVIGFSFKYNYNAQFRVSIKDKDKDKDNLYDYSVKDNSERILLASKIADCLKAFQSEVLSIVNDKQSIANKQKLELENILTDISDTAF